MYHNLGFFFSEWGPFAGLSFKATSIPLRALAHFTVPKKFWKSAIWQSVIRQLLLKTGWWLTLERLLHTSCISCFLATFVQFLRENLIFGTCKLFCQDFGHLSDICQTWIWCESLGDTLTRSLFQCHREWPAYLFWSTQLLSSLAQ